VIVEQRTPEVTVRDVLAGGPAPRDRGRLRHAALRGLLLVAAAAAGAGWAAQQSLGTQQDPLLVSIQKSAAGTAQPWGTLSADLPGTSCAALVDWPRVRAASYGIERTLPCADGSEVRAWISLDRQEEPPHLQVTLQVDAGSLTGRQAG
jgi:hypothetical protein